MNKIRLLLGDYAEKRQMLRESGNAFADNEEIAFITRLCGKDYFLSTAHPFADFTAEQYARYQCSISHANMPDVFATARTLGWNLRRTALIKRYHTTELRLLTLLCKATADTTHFGINLDGLPYSRRNKALLCKLLNSLAKIGNVTASVSDSRFITADTQADFVRCGFVFCSRRRIYSRSVSKRFAKHIAQSKSNIVLPKLTNIVCVS